jgi:hypothetical protein
MIYLAVAFHPGSWMIIDVQHECAEIQPLSLRKEVMAQASEKELLQ